MARKRKNITKFKINPDDVQKANRRGSREAELDITKGFPKSHTAHKNKKAYKRNKKHKGDN